MQTGPITAVGVVSDPSQCPPSYDVIVKSSDKREDCDLWRDGVFKSARTTRYLCISRSLQKHQGNQQEVLTNITLLSERDPIPESHFVVEKTMDTLEKATKKKLLCVKMVPLCECDEVVCDIILLSRNKKPPSEYIMSGETNGLIMCHKICRISDLGDSTLVQQIIQDKNKPHEPHESLFKHKSDYSSINEVISDHHSNMPGTVVLNAVFDIPFQISSNCVDESVRQELVERGHIVILHKSFLDIEREYDYDYALERSAGQQAL